MRAKLSGLGIDETGAWQWLFWLAMAMHLRPVFALFGAVVSTGCWACFSGSRYGGSLKA